MGGRYVGDRMVYGRSKIEGLRQEAKERFLRAEPRLVQLEFDVYIVETVRSLLVQLAYFAQGRTSTEEVNQIRSAAGLAKISDPAPIVTYVDGILKRSKHQEGLALDVVPYEPTTGRILWNASEGMWKRLGEIARESGFAWGGDWKTHPAAALGWDCPHWEVP